jgi:hypothetical protein
MEVCFFFDKIRRIVKYQGGGRTGRFFDTAYRGTSLIRNNLPLGPYSRPMPRALRWSAGGGGVL